MDPFESRLKSVPLRKPSAAFGTPEVFAELTNASQPTHSLAHRIHAMSPKSKAAALLGLAASLAAVVLALTAPMGRSDALAQVVDALRKAKTLSFDAKLTSVSDGKLLGKSRHLYMVPGKLRTEMQMPDGQEGYVVFDMPAHKVLMVDLIRKTAHISDLEGAAGQDMAAAAIEVLRSLPTDDARPVPDREIDGMSAKGFEVDREFDATTFWADPDTGAPLRIEYILKNYPAGPAKQVWTNIKLDEELDSALFSLDPPAGFATAPFIAIDFNATPLQHVSKFLKLYADYMDGEFPPRLQDALKLLAEKLGPLAPNEQPSEERLMMSAHGAGMTVVTLYGKHGEDWQYYPGHKLGEKDQVIFWHLDKKQDEYSALYGDLRIEEVAKDQLPPPPAE